LVNGAEGGNTRGVKGRKSHGAANTKTAQKKQKKGDGWSKKIGKKEENSTWAEKLISIC